MRRSRQVAEGYNGLTILIQALGVLFSDHSHCVPGCHEIGIHGAV